MLAAGARLHNKQKQAAWDKKSEAKKKRAEARFFI
jgi:hypothetical protein